MERAIHTLQGLVTRGKLKRIQDEVQQQLTMDDHFLLPFIDQVLERLIGKSHYCFLDGFSSYMEIHIALEDQHKTTSTWSSTPLLKLRFLSIYAMPQAPSRVDTCLECLSKVLHRFIKSNLPLNFKKSHFMVIEGIVIRHLVFSRGPKLILLQNSLVFSWTCRFLKEIHPRFQQNSLAIVQAFIIGCGAPDWELPFELICDAFNFALWDNYTTTKKELLAFDFTLDKFHSYLLGSKIIIRDKNGVENLVADHLSRIEGRIDPLYLLYMIFLMSSLCSSMVLSYGLLTLSTNCIYFTPKVSRFHKDKIISDGKYYMWNDPYLWKFCND
ncbi:hypothetical protein CR513_04710, partial [Mucuna pruriens]